MHKIRYSSYIKIDMFDSAQKKIGDLAYFLLFGKVSIEEMLRYDRYWLQSVVGNIGEKERINFNQALHSSQVLSTIYPMR